MDLIENKIEITLYRQEILRHVQDAAWLMSKATASKSETPTKEDSYLMDVFKKTFDGDGNDELATRYMTNAFHYCVTFFRDNVNDYITDGSTLSRTDGISKPESYTLILYAADIHASDVKYITELMHGILAADILYNWCILVAPEYLERIAAMKTQNENMLLLQRNVLTNRRRPAKRNSRRSFYVSLGVNDKTLGTVLGGGTYAEGTNVIVTATEKTLTSGKVSQFVGWYNDDRKVSTDATYTFAAKEDCVLIAVFEEKEQEQNSGLEIG